jgi:pimeloyl-ACP methyl ester carboxylesterase
MIQRGEMSNIKIVHVPHLGGIDAAYRMPMPYDPSKPTLVLINAFTTTSELFTEQFSNTQLTSNMNLLAIELLGHGQTRTAREHWTYWDSAEMNLQVLDMLGIEKAFVLGTSQGGWVSVQMALMCPNKVSKFDEGSQRTQTKERRSWVSSQSEHLWMQSQSAVASYTAGKVPIS